MCVSRAVHEVLGFVHEQIAYFRKLTWCWCMRSSCHHESDTEENKNSVRGAAGVVTMFLLSVSSAPSVVKGVSTWSWWRFETSCQSGLSKLLVQRSCEIIFEASDAVNRWPFPTIWAAHRHNFCRAPSVFLLKHGHGHHKVDVRVILRVVLLFDEA